MRDLSTGLALLLAACVFVQSYWGFFVINLLFRAGTLASAICTRTLCQNAAAEGAIGRVMAFRSAALDCSGVALYALGLYLVAHVAVNSVLLIGSGGFMLAAVLSLTGKGVSLAECVTRNALANMGNQHRIVFRSHPCGWALDLRRSFPASIFQRDYLLTGSQV